MFLSSQTFYTAKEILFFLFASMVKYHFFKNLDPE